MVFLLPLHFATLFLEAVALTMSKFSLTAWREIYQPLVPAVWRARTEVLRLRKNIHSGQNLHSVGFFSTFRWMPRKLNMLFRHGLPVIVSTK
jgi:hypothetical protein